jgi:integrase
MAMLMALQKMGRRAETVTHGFRSSFSDWAYTHTSYRAEIIESCLAHTEGKGSKVKRAYLRTNFAEDCAKVLRQWHDFVLGEAAAAANVLPLRAA